MIKNFCPDDELWPRLRIKRQVQIGKPFFHAIFINVLKFLEWRWKGLEWKIKEYISLFSLILFLLKKCFYVSLNKIADLSSQIHCHAMISGWPKDANFIAVDQNIAVMPYGRSRSTIVNILGTEENRHIQMSEWKNKF